MTLPYASKTTEAIKRAADDRYGTSDLTNHTAGDRRFVVVTGDTASGTTRLDIYVYLHEADNYCLLLMRPSNTSRVTVGVRDKALELVSKAGRCLARIPLDGVSLAYSRDEQ